MESPLRIRRAPQRTRARAAPLGSSSARRPTQRPSSIHREVPAEVTPRESERLPRPRGTPAPAEGARRLQRGTPHSPGAPASRSRLPSQARRDSHRWRSRKTSARSARGAEHSRRRPHPRRSERGGTRRLMQRSNRRPRPRVASRRGCAWTNRNRIRLRRPSRNSYRG